jgi:HlyD family secretion protein
VAGGLWSGLREGGWMTSTAEVQVEGQVVQRGPLRVTVVQRGNLSAKNSVKVTNELEGNVQILSLIEEGSQVKKGDLLVVLDTSSLQDRENAGDISVQNAQAALTNAKQNLDIQISQNVSDYEKAKQDLNFAQIDQSKYLEGDWEQQQKAAEESIALAEQELKQAEDRLEKSIELHNEDFLTDTELEADQLARNRAEIKHKQAIRAKELLIEFDHPKQIAVLVGKIKEAERELNRVELQSEARLVNAQSVLTTSQAKYDLEAEKLAKLRDQIGKAKIYSPCEGIVVYTREKSRWGSGQLMEEGASVREHQEIITIPQSGGMLAEASLHESVIKKVSTGQTCIIRVDAIPNSEYNGVVDFVALLPDSGSSWMNPNQRLFRTNIAVTDADPEMRPGMSCSVEILVKEIPDTLFVPVQAVFHSGGQSICFVGGEQRDVEIGAASEKWVEILSGLTEGEVVQLSPPTNFQPEPPPQMNGDGKRPGGADGSHGK